MANQDAICKCMRYFFLFGTEQTLNAPPAGHQKFLPPLIFVYHEVRKYLDETLETDNGGLLDLHIVQLKGFTKTTIELLWKAAKIE